VVEALFFRGRSFISQQYKLPKKGTEIEVELRVLWNERDRMLKLSLPTSLQNAAFFGQVACGVEELKRNGEEMVAQKWVAAVSRRRNMALTVINEGIHGLDAARGEVRLSLLRSPAHAGHPVEGREILGKERYIPRIDQGERLFRFWINGGPAADRLARVDTEALVKNEQPFLLPFFPSGEGRKPKPGLRVSDPGVQVLALKKAEQGRDLVIRLFEPRGKKRLFTISLPFAGTRRKMSLKPFEIKTLRFNPRTGRIKEVNLMEEPLKKGKL
jgi:alpha-mannosidase